MGTQATRVETVSVDGWLVDVNADLWASNRGYRAATEAWARELKAFSESLPTSAGLPQSGVDWTQLDGDGPQ